MWLKEGGDIKNKFATKKFVKDYFEFLWHMSKERFDNKIACDRKAIKRITILAATSMVISITSVLLHLLKKS